MLTAYDENMNPIGDYPRSYVHGNGMWHRVAQCWIVNRTDTGIVVYLQRRSFEKTSNPGRYDISSGGHVSAGETPEVAIVREVREETGLRLDRGRLTEIGTFREETKNDKELAHIFVYFIEGRPAFAPGNEVLYMVQTKLEDLYHLYTDRVDRILVTPTVRTGSIWSETFTVKKDKVCTHDSFVEMVYPFITRCFGEDPVAQGKGLHYSFGDESVKGNENRK